MIYIVDSSDVERIEESRDELHSILQDDGFPKDATLLVFANKQDAPDALAPSNVAERLCLGRLKQRQWFCQASIATRGDGLFEGMEWLCQAMKKQGKS